MASPAPTQAKKPKGILKKPSTSTSTIDPATAAEDAASFPVTPFLVPEPEPSASIEDQEAAARKRAIEGALAIHERWRHEDRILDSIIELARLPLSTTTNPPLKSSSQTQAYTASNPSPNDTAHFLSSIRHFQPGDYEDLIQERNALNKCGYCLCPRPRTKLSGAGAFKLLSYGRADFSIVPRGEVERWCSRQCARRAMYVKVQLQETTVAEREAIESIQIELLEKEEEEKSKSSKGEKHKGDDPTRRVAKELRDVKNKEGKAARDAKDLALERGDKTNSSPSTAKPFTLTIREKKVTMAAQEPSLDTDGEGHLVLDGYKTKFDPKADPDE
ncbi:hypothetical protein F4805DRAFT_283171 [Annulohypoxylon moriforme]|nr:hypothetical protein F4805DRAFT_283171 [Annulohypoxylon moriforme]